MSPTGPNGTNTGHKRGLKKKLVLSMLLVGALPLLVGMSLAFLQGTKEIQEVNGSSFQALATETARKLDLVLQEEISKTNRIAGNLTLVHALETRRDALRRLKKDEIGNLMAAEALAWDRRDPKLLQTITKSQLSQIINKFGIQGFNELETPVPIVTRSATLALFVTDIAGRLVTSINDRVRYAHVKEPWWIGAYNQGAGQPYLGNVTFDKQLNTYTFTLSLPIMDSLRYQVVGILHRVYDAKEFFAPALSPIRFGKTGHVMLIDSQGIVMSCPILPTGVRLADTRLIPLVTPAEPGWVLAPSDGHGGEDTSIIGFAPLPAISRITKASTGTSWHMFVWQSSEELFGPIQHLFAWIAGFGLLAIVLLTALGFMAAGRIVTPIRQLQVAAALIGRGELKEPITITTNDEIQDLTEEINRMNERLQAAFAGLTSEVEMKTQEVQFLRESTDQILGNVPDPVIVLDRQGGIHYMNQAAQRAFQLENASVEGQNFFDIITLDRASQERLKQEFQRIGTGQPPPPSGSASSAPPQPQDPLNAQLLKGGDALPKRLEINDRIYQYECFLIRAGSEERTRIGLTLRDTTDESRMHDQLAQSEKMASLGILSAGIGHELNNPLVGVIGYGEAILEENDPTHMKELARKIVERGRQMASIIQDFTGQTRGTGQSRYLQADINEQLRQAIHSIQAAPDQTAVEITTDFQELPTISAKPDELRQAFINILNNAVQAVGNQGTVSVSTEISGDHIHIHIRDTGPGISKPYLSKIFDPFFTTKRQGEGSGLGLTIAQRIIHRYGGQIQITSEEGQGTDCLISFDGHTPQEGTTS